MKYDYYKHRSGGFVFDYFGGVGTAVKINILWYYCLKITGYRVTKVPAGSPLVDVYVKAAIKGGAGANSWKVQKIKEYGEDRGL
jgi:predicted SAM-dependent methyltransferase